MGRPATVLVVLAAATLAVASATPTASAVPTGEASFSSATPVSDSAVNFVAAAAAATNTAATPAVDVRAALHATRALRGRLSRQAPIPDTCMTMAEFKGHISNTKKGMKSIGVPSVDIEAFERTILDGYKKFIVREEGDKFCVRTDPWTDWIVKVFLDACDGKLRS